MAESCNNRNDSPNWRKFHHVWGVGTLQMSDNQQDLKEMNKMDSFWTHSLKIRMNLIHLNKWIVWNGKKIWHWKMNSPGRYMPNMLLKKSGEIAPERMKRLRQNENSAQLLMWLVMEVKSNAIKNNIAYEPEMLGPWVKVNWKRSNGRWQEWTLTF